MSKLLETAGSLSGIFAESFTRELGKQTARRVMPVTTNVQMVDSNNSAAPSLLKEVVSSVSKVEKSSENVVPRPLVAGAALALVPLGVNFLYRSFSKK